MRRSLAPMLLLAATMGTMVPSGAAPPQVVRGSIELPVLTPTVPRALYLAAEESPNGVVGWVAPLSPSDNARPYELRVLDAASPSVDADVYFYRDLEGEYGTGDPCARDADASDGGGETGSACVGATHAIVLLFTGAAVDFELRVG